MLRVTSPELTCGVSPFVDYSRFLRLAYDFSTARGSVFGAIILLSVCAVYCVVLKGRAGEGDFMTELDVCVTYTLSWAFGRSIFCF